MSSPAPLRLVVTCGEAPFGLDPRRAFRPAPPLVPRPGSRAFLLAALAAFVVHAATLALMMARPDGDLARTAGAAEDLILIEGIPVELVESMPTPEAPPADAAVAPETPVEPVDDERLEETPPEVRPEVTEPPPGMPQAPVDAALPPDGIGDLPARPEEPQPKDLPSETPLPPLPRPRPERAAPEDSTPAPAPAAQPKPVAPPPGATTAASSAARSGGAGGGGAAQTAGKAADSAYRARVAAQLARKKFYPNAARRERLTGQATVRFTLDAAGRVTAVKVVRSAGSRILDDAALEMVRRGAPYPPIPNGLGSTITVHAPIGFALPP